MRRVTVRIETPRGGFVKRRDDGSLDFVSPLPCPFHYGSLPGTLSHDGEPVDALVLGSFGARPIARGSLVDVGVHGEVRFHDAGVPDAKLVTGERPPTRFERWLVVGFFVAYARAKQLLYVVRGVPGETRFLGVVWERPG